MIEQADTPIERAIAAGDREFRELAEFAPAMIWRSGPDRLCDWFNRPWLAFAGEDITREVGDGWADRLHPDDTVHCLATYADAFARREPFCMEYRMRRHDGEYRWLLDNGTPYERGGRFAGYWGSCTDVTTLRQAQLDQCVLINDLTHRVKNTMAVVQAMAMQSFREGRPVEDAMEAFESRLAAMATAQDLLVTRTGKDVSLRGVVLAAVAPHDPGDRISIEGPDVTLRPETAMSVAMVIHELLTNAAKYGALSNDAGTVAICWTCEAEVGNADRLRLAWKESGGPVVVPPRRRGFGTRFIERALGGSPGTGATMHFHPEGVECLFVTPIARTPPIARTLPIAPTPPIAPTLPP